LNYKEALDYILGAETMGSILERNIIECLLSELGSPHKGLKYVHIAGTNGKGSTSAMLSSMLRAAGYKTGLYTSPYIQQFNERIQVDGVQISDEELAGITAEIAEAAARLKARGLRHPTVFELITALGFVHFSRQACDIVVLEVGLGGRLDATNVIDSPEVAVITNIGLDHMDCLGDTLELIAREKAGIIKQGCDVVLYSQTKSVEDAIASVCKEKGASLAFADSSLAKVRSVALDGIEFDYNGYSGLKTSLLGIYQVGNAVTAIVTAEQLRRKGYAISEQNIADGLSFTHWPGRLEVLRRDPVVIVDGAHNPQGALALTDSLRAIFPGRKVNFLIGVLADKDYSSTIELTMPLAKSYHTITPPNSRALSAQELAAEIKRHGSVPVFAYDDIPSAIDAVLASTPADEIVCIFGSLYQIGEVRSYFGRDTF